MILFDRTTKSASTDLERLPESPSTEIEVASSAEFFWKDPTDVLRGEEVLTTEGWQQAKESGWQLHLHFDTPYGLTVKSSGIRRVLLPRIYWPDGRPAVQVRKPHNDFYDRAVPEELFAFTMASLETLQKTLDQAGELTVCCEDGSWRTTHRLILPSTRGGKVKHRRARAVAAGNDGDEVFKFRLYDLGLKGYGVDLKWGLDTQVLESYAQEKLRPREGF